MFLLVYANVCIIYFYRFLQEIKTKICTLKDVFYFLCMLMYGCVCKYFTRFFFGILHIKLHVRTVKLRIDTQPHLLAPHDIQFPSYIAHLPQ